MAIVVGASLLVGRPIGPMGYRPASVSLAVATPATPQPMQSYFALMRKTGVSPFTTGGRLPGRVVRFEIENLVGLPGDRCELRWTQLNRASLRPATEGVWRYNDVLGWPDGLVFPAATAAPIGGELWVPEPDARVDVGQFFVRVRLLCGGREVARSDTASFQVGANGAAETRPASEAARTRHRPRRRRTCSSESRAVTPGGTVGREKAGDDD